MAEATAVGIAVADGNGVAECVAVGSGVEVRVGLIDGTGVGVAVGSGVTEAVTVGKGVRVCVWVADGMSVGLAVGVGGKVAGLVDVARDRSVDVGVGSGVSQLNPVAAKILSHSTPTTLLSLFTAANSPAG